MKFIRRIVVLVTGCLLVAGCNMFVTGKTPPSDPSRSADSGQSWRVGWRDLEKATLEHDGLIRKYFYHDPRADVHSEKIPIVIALHGGGSHPKNIVHRSMLADLARQHDFLAMFPQGSSGPFGRLLTWNAGGCCGKAARRGVDDVGFINQLIERMVSQHNVDRQRVYITGFSNGGMLTYRLACELSDQIAAIAPVAAVMPGPDADTACTPAMPVAVIAFHGLADPRVLYTGKFDDQSRQTRLSVPESIAAWKNINACGNPVNRQDDGYSLLSYKDCVADVELYTVSDLGHRWPGWDRRLPGGRRDPQASVTIDASKTMWKFFSTHSTDSVQ